MAHASSSERAKIKMKKIRATRKNQRYEWNKNTEEEKTAIINARHEMTNTDKLTLALWDYDHKQYPTSKYHILKELIKTELKTKKDVRLENLLREL